MSPEQANGFPLDARSDIYALGVVLFELITGREPYQAETPMALLLKHINEPMPAASIYRSDAPPAVENVISRATAKDPGDRYASAGDMARAYRDALEHPRTAPAATRSRPDDESPTYIPPETPPQGVPAPRTGTRPGPTQPQAAASRVLPPPARAGSGRSPVLIGVIALVVLVLGIVGVLVVPGLLAPPATPAPDAKATHDAILAVLPTPFSGANQVSKDAYSISMPNNWSSSEDTSNPARSLYIWTAPDSSAFVTLSLVDADLSGGDQFQSAIDNYQDQYYASQAQNLSLIDEAVAPDGTLRRSYRLVNMSDPRFPPGQMDVFYLNRSPYLAVLETYSADSTGNALVPTFQMIFDSMRIKSN
jgi:serine/threonine protein kinase